jgi:3-oxoacyl-[acyl-carrier protein] reductase
MKFQNKIILITGAGKGIGRELAIFLSKNNNSRIIINYSKSKNQAVNTVKEISKLGGQAIAIRADISKRNDVLKMVNKTIKRFGRIDILINNAGIVEANDWKNISDKEWQRVVDVNLKGTFECSRAAGQIMLRQKHGKIINISSLRGILGASDIIAYSTAKAGVINLTKSFAKALAPYVNVNCLVLGRMNIGMNRTDDKKLIKDFAGETLVKRMGSIDDIIASVDFLTSDKSSFITGQTLIVDGGASLK